jgi:cyclophilin family peptidyl-prolyl cis-trans isomerase
MASMLFSVGQQASKTPHFLPIHVYVGEVIEGMDLVTAIEKKGSASGKPSAEIKISASGTY